MESTASMIEETRPPHDHAGNAAKREGRVVLRVRVRANSMGVMLADGHLHGPGEHLIQVYRSDVKHVEAMVEREEHLVEAAERLHAKKLEKYVSKGKDPVTYDGNVPGEFQILAQRDMLPLTFCEPDGELGSIRDEEKQRDAEMHRDVARATSGGASELGPILASIVKTQSETTALLGRIDERMTQIANAQNRKGG